MTEMREIQIQFGDIVMTLPKSIEAISTARDLLDMLEESIVSKWVCKHCGCTENTPCPGGCFWVAPNLCSRCAAENTPEVPEPETLRNVSVPARESAITTEQNLKGIVRRDVIHDSPLTLFPPDDCKFKNNTAPPAKVLDTLKSETQGSTTADSHSAGATDSHHGVGEGEKHDDISQSSSTEQRDSTQQQKQPAKQKTKLGTPGTFGIMHPSDLKLPAFEYDKNKMQQYKTIFFQELSDGRVALDYCDSHYYATKDAVLQIPYPFPQNYFSKENGWSSSVEQAFKKYRMYLAEQEQQQQLAEPEKEKEKQTVDLDEWKYKPFLKTNTRTNYDGNKVEGALE